MQDAEKLAMEIMSGQIRAFALVDALRKYGDARARDAEKQFRFYGSDDCHSCHWGRITLYVKSRDCVECQNKALPLAAEDRGGGEGE